jgi:monoamine oxidase
MTLEAYCQKYVPGMGGWLANKVTEGLLGVNASEVGALFMIDYFHPGTSLPNLASDQKDGGQYIRNRKGMAGLRNLPSKNTT